MLTVFLNIGTNTWKVGVCMYVLDTCVVVLHLHETRACFSSYFVLSPGHARSGSYPLWILLSYVLHILAASDAFYCFNEHKRKLNYIRTLNPYGINFQFFTQLLRLLGWTLGKKPSTVPCSIVPLRTTTRPKSESRSGGRLGLARRYLIRFSNDVLLICLVWPCFVVVLCTPPSLFSWK